MEYTFLEKINIAKIGKKYILAAILDFIQNGASYGQNDFINRLHILNNLYVEVKIIVFSFKFQIVDEKRKSVNIGQF